MFKKSSLREVKQIICSVQDKMYSVQNKKCRFYKQHEYENSFIEKRQVGRQVLYFFIYEKRLFHKYQFVDYPKVIYTIFDYIEKKNRKKN